MLKNMLRFVKDKVFLILDIIMFPFTYIFCIWLRQVRLRGLHKSKINKYIFNKIGLLPITNHFYEPFFTVKDYKKRDRILPGLDFNTQEQLDNLNNFNYNDELLEIPMEKQEELTYYYNNLGFESGDAEFLYNMIRFNKPERIIEIGSGNSTLIALKAILKNKEENREYKCEQICIEPYLQGWLEQFPFKVIRERVEALDKEIFLSLKENDILFIDSSHVIRPQGDVVFEFLEILPILKPGVFVHIHDIFSPNDYPNDWIFDNIKLFNEQYLLEAFLTNNSGYKVIGAVNYLKHHYPQELYNVCPILKTQSFREPGSFWIQKRQDNN